MARASPSIIARVGVKEVSSKNRLPAVIAEMVMPIPMIALSSGRPAATNDPNVMMSTIAATPSPISSAAPCSNSSCSASPPISTVSPASRAGSTASLSGSFAAGNSTSKPTSAKPIRSSGEMVPAWNGSATFTTSGTCARSATAVSIAAWLAGSLRV
jgi:hypothetical protein